eukprot:11223964-Lingulodinium_polyedra.AAC.1
MVRVGMEDLLRLIQARASLVANGSQRLTAPWRTQCMLTGNAWLHWGWPSRTSAWRTTSGTCSGAGPPSCEACST